MKQPGIKQIAENRKARHDYFILETYEAGIALVGTEVKSIRNGNVNLKDSWCSIEDGQLLLRDMHVSPYEKGNVFNQDPRRVRVLLMHKREILKLFGTDVKNVRTVVVTSRFVANEEDAVAAIRQAETLAAGEGLYVWQPPA